MHSLFSFGGFYLVCGDASASFPLNIGTISYPIKRQEWTTRDRVDRQRIIGMQPIIKVQLHNLNDDQSVQFSNLVAVINNHLYDSTPITIKPRFDVDEDYGLSYSCDLVSDFSPDDIADCEAGQTIDLVFRSRHNVNQIPNIFSGFVVYNVIDYNSNTLVDYSGNQVQAIN